MLKVIVPWIAGYMGLIVLDLLWLGVIASGFYRNQIGHLMHIVDGNMSVNIPAALLTWAVIVTGVQVFAFPRALAIGTLPTFILWGALFGAITYAVYDLTNYAVLKNWTLAVTVADILWGAFVCAATALCMALAHRALLRFF